MLKPENILNDQWVPQVLHMGSANSLNRDLRGDSERVTRVPAASPNCSVEPTVGSSNVATCAINPWPNLAGFHIHFHHHNVSHERTKTPRYWPTVLLYRLLYSSSCPSSTITKTTFTIHSNCHHYEPDSLRVFLILTWRCLLKDPINAKPMKHRKHILSPPLFVPHWHNSIEL